MERARDHARADEAAHARDHPARGVRRRATTRRPGSATPCTARSTPCARCRACSPWRSCSATSARAARGAASGWRSSASTTLLLELVARRRAEPRGDSVLALLLEQRDEDGNPPSDRHLRDQLVALLAGGPRHLGGLARVGVRAARPPPGRPGAPARGRPGLPRRGGQGGPARAAGAHDRAAPAARAGGDRRAEAARRACTWPPASGSRCAARTSGRRRGAFRPERWLAGAPPPNPMSWIPFGGGVRRCAGAPVRRDGDARGAARGGER